MDLNRISIRLFAEATFYCESCREKRVKSDEADVYCEHHSQIENEMAKIIPPEILKKEMQK